MSLRTALRFLLAAIVAASAVSPTLAQTHNPWVGSASQAPMPRAKKTRSIEIQFSFSSKAGPALRVTPTNIDFFHEEMLGNGTAMRLVREVTKTVTSAPQCPGIDCSRPVAAAQVPTPQVVCEPGYPERYSIPTRTAVLAPFAVQAHNGTWIAGAVQTPGTLAGTWYRESDSIVIAATFTNNELVLTTTQNLEGNLITIMVTADYAVTKDGLVHGVVTGADAQMKASPTRSAKNSRINLSNRDLASFSSDLQELVDSPFAFRIKQTSAGIMVSGLRFAGLEGLDGKERLMLCGMYKQAANAKAVPAPEPTPVEYSVAEFTLPSVQCPSTVGPHSGFHFANPQQFTPACPQPCLPYGTPQPVMPAGYVPPPPPAMLQPTPNNSRSCIAPPPAQPMSWSPSYPGNVPAGEFTMIAEAFGQMMGVNSHAVPCPAPTASAPTGCDRSAYPLPTPTAATHTLVLGGCEPCPVPCPPAATNCVSANSTFAITSPATATPVANSKLLGTWVREVGPYVYVITIAPDHLTLKAMASGELDNKQIVTEGLIITADYHLSRDGTTLVGLITGVDAHLEGVVAGMAQPDNLTDSLASLQRELCDKPLALSIRAYGETLVIGNVRMPSANGDQGGTRIPTFGGRYTSPKANAIPKPKVMRLTPALPVNDDLGFQLPALPCPQPNGESIGAPQLTVPSDHERIRQFLHEKDESKQIQDQWRQYWQNRPQHLTPERIHGAIY